MKLIFQMNGYDCGPFMLEFISKFTETTPKIDVAFLHSKGGDVFQKYEYCTYLFVILWFKL